jgi:hypothetical protein
MNFTTKFQITLKPNIIEPEIYLSSHTSHLNEMEPSALISIECKIRVHYADQANFKKIFLFCRAFAERNWQAMRSFWNEKFRNFSQYIIQMISSLLSDLLWEEWIWGSFTILNGKGMEIKEELK